MNGLCCSSYEKKNDYFFAHARRIYKEETINQCTTFGTKNSYSIMPPKNTLWFQTHHLHAFFSFQHWYLSYKYKNHKIPFD